MGGGVWDLLNFTTTTPPENESPGTRVLGTQNLPLAQPQMLLALLWPNFGTCPASGRGAFGQPLVCTYLTLNFSWGDETSPETPWDAYPRVSALETTLHSHLHSAHLTQAVDPPFSTLPHPTELSLLSPRFFLPLFGP